ncbi:MAG: major outer membrane protein [Campylobacteraceae bacterium]|jgi:hypothetical protein|nr:major outer membrane protein [Campylobacteraceae bacterium]
MKLTKLSLAAIVAVGALGSFASATPLEEAIKGVDISGFARLRYQHNTESFTGFNDVTSEAIRVSGEFNAVVPVADGLAFGTTLTTDGYNFPDSGASAPTGDLGTQSFNFDKYYFLYSGVKDLAVIGGKYTIPAPWAESGFAGSRGNGLVALYSGVPNWTFAGALYLQTNGFDDSWLGELGTKNNLYALGAIGKAGPVDLQVWAAKIEHLIDTTVFAQASFAQAGFNVRAQVNYLKLADALDIPAVGLALPSTIVADDAGLFYGVEGGYKNDQFFVTAGYTQTDADQPVYALDADNDGFIKFGQQLYYASTNLFDTATFFIKGGATFNQFGFEAGYGLAQASASFDASYVATTLTGIGRDTDFSEIYALVSYQLAPKFGVQLYYSLFDGDSVLADNDEIQLELKYSF